MAIDPRDKQDIITDTYRIGEILKTNIFSPENQQHTLSQSAFIEVIILLRDLIQKAKKYNLKISFKDDVLITDKVQDVSDLIAFIRNAACHIESDKNDVDQSNNRIRFCVAYGKCRFAEINDVVIASDYEDDICFFFGEQKIYLRRHIIRAFNEAKQNLISLDPFLAHILSN